jgi:hypothetical protein
MASEFMFSADTEIHQFFKKWGIYGTLAHAYSLSLGCIPIMATLFRYDNKLRIRESTSRGVIHIVSFIWK